MTRRRSLLPLGLAGSVLVLLAGCRGSLWLRNSSTAPARKEIVEALAAKLDEDAWSANPDWSPQREWETRQGGRPAPDAMRWTLGREPAQGTLQDSSVSPSNGARGPDASRGTDPAGNDGGSDRESPSSPPEAGGEDAEKAETEKTDHADPSDEAGSQKSSADDEASSAGPPEARGIRDGADPSQKTWDGFWPMDVGTMLDRLDRQSSLRRSGGRASPSRPDPPLAVLARRRGLVGWNAAILQARRQPGSAAGVAPVLERLVTDPPRYDAGTKKTAADGGTDTSGVMASVRDWLGTGDAMDRPAADGFSPDEAEKAQPISPALRNAAAEAWCLVLGFSGDDPRRSLAPVGRLLESPELPTDLRSELFRGTARWIEPAAIPRLSNALQVSPDGQRAPLEIRRAAVEACLIHALWHRPQGAADGAPFEESLWPQTIESCRFDPEASVRQIFGRWLAVVRHPRALDLLKDQLRDRDPQVRDEALISLGILGTEKALEELREQAESSAERVRTAAARGLARFGVRQAAPMIQDTSFRVRQAVAESLARSPTAEAARLIRDLLVDSNIQVQQAAVRSLRDWPDELAVPLLLQGMRDALLATRRQCDRQLRQRTEVEDVFPAEAPYEERAAFVVRLIREHELPAGSWDRLSREATPSGPRRDAVHAAEVRSDLADMFDHPPDSPEYLSALDRLKKLDRHDVPLIEEFIHKHPDRSHRLLLQEVLPELSPVYRALADLDETDVHVRRRAARKLTEIGASRSLSRLAVNTLRDRLVDEQDRLVWRSAVAAVMRDANDEAAQVALLAINRTWPDIQVLGCEYVGRHGRPEQALWLQPLFGDPNKTVRLAAVRAAGRCHNPAVLDGRPGSDDEPAVLGLRDLLTDADPQFRLAVAVSMSRLGDPQGMQELIRLSHHPSPAMRETVVGKMGETGRTRFVRQLVRISWTEDSDRVKRAILESLEQLVPAAKRPDGLLDAADVDAKIERWVEWWQAGRAAGRINGEPVESGRAPPEAT